MQKECICMYCNQQIGYDETHKHRAMLEKHYKLDHRTEYNEMRDAFNAYLELSMRYRFDYAHK
jgi:hypothetical protein